MPDLPNAGAQHYTFRMKMRAILRNAPKWVTSVLASEPNSYFLPEDRLLVPEVGAIYTHAVLLFEMDHPERIAPSAMVPGHAAREA